MKRCDLKCCDLKRCVPVSGQKWLPLMFTLLLAWASAGAVQAASVWKVSDGEREMYLAGTVHLLKSSDYPLPTAFEVAYEHSDVLMFETDLAAAHDPENQQQITRRMLAGPEETVDKVLTAHTYGTLQQACERYGLNLSDLRSFKVSLLVLTLTMVEMKRLGLTSSGVDEYFHQRARRDGKAIVTLESFEQQIDFLARMGRGNEDAFVAMSLRDLNQTEALMDDMIQSWRNGDMETMTQLFVENMEDDYPAMYQQLLVDRNNHWMPRIEALLLQPGTAFVLVGVGHMVGEAGLLSQLTARGYEVQTVPDAAPDAVPDTDTGF